MIEIEHHVNDVQRRVGTRVLEAGEARTVTIARAFGAPLHDVWDACTNPDRIPRWFLPVSGELRVGGRYQLRGNAGGTVESCEPPTSFTATWEMGGSISWIELRLSGQGEERTRLELAHIAAVGDEDHWSQFGPGAVGIGWDLALLGLALHMGSGAAVDPKDFVAWSASQDGKRFITLSGERWCEADIAAGTDAADATAKAQRTTDFYTGSAATSG